MRTTARRSLLIPLAWLLGSHVLAADVTELSRAPQEIMTRLIGETLPDDSPALVRAFGLAGGEGLSLLSSRDARDGRRISRYVQTYRNVPVWGRQLIITRSADGRISGLRGSLVRGIAGEIGQRSPGIGRDAMVNTLRTEVAAGYPVDLPIFEREKAELVIYIDDQDSARLAYEVEFLADVDGGGAPSRPVFVVDATTGEVLESWDALAHQAVTGDCSTKCTLLELSGLSGNQVKGRKGNPWTYLDPIVIPAEVPAGSTMTVTISGDNGDADLYTLRGAAPTSSQYDCRPYLQGSNESCSHTVSAGESWYIGLYAYSSFSNLSLRVSVKAPIVVYDYGQGPGGNEKVGIYYYDYDFPALSLQQDASNRCVMNNANVKTVDLNNGTSGNTAFAYDLWPDCYNNHDAVNGAFSPLNDAHYFGQVVFDMYDQWLGTAPLTFQLTMRVHYSTNYENAFWDGSAMTFGDGFSYFHPLVSLDVSAHEVSHGFTEQNSDLIYSGQSGGINEAYSDIAGEAAEYFMTGEADFLVGADIVKGPGALRYMANPPLDGVSIGHVDDFTANMDVHYSSGVFNKAFYTLATTPGWDVRKAFEVFAWANRDYWTPDTNFQVGAEGVLQAAIDGGYPASAVIAAFEVVGITLQLAEPPGAPVLTIDPAAVNYNRVELSWLDVANESGYRIIRNGSEIGAVSAGTTAYVDSTVTAETSYTYTIQAFNNYGSSDSNVVVVDTPAEPPAPAVSLNVVAYKVKGSNYADLTVSGVSPFAVYVNGASTPLVTGVVGSNFTDNTGQKGGMSRTYQVCGEDAAGNTVCSAVVTVVW